MNPPTEEIKPKTEEEIFQAACDLPPDRRSAFLDETCTGDAELRRRIENLLRHHDEDSGFMEVPAVEDAFKEIVSNEGRERASKPTQPMIGRQIGNYRVLALLGKGGMGEVYLARDLELDVDVVIKLLREEFKDDPEWMARFNREGRLNAELNHPNIAGIRYKGEVDGRQFLVFEFVAGETLEARLKKGVLHVKEALPMFSQLAEALSFAHGKGIIHRDLKPANLMVTPESQLKVLDFGIAKKVTADLTTIELDLPEEELTTDFGSTRKGEVMG
ncbi:MAG: serine/threonine protein kinase, partial [Blastocatellia bacterium]